jgi:hypothetical protein
MSAVQTTVNINYGFGVIGEVINDGPTRASSRIVNSSGTPNIIGYAYTRSNTTDICTVGGAITNGSTVFGGILSNPKEYASYGTTAGTLAPTLTLPDNWQGDFVEMGTIVVALTTAANIGDLVTYVLTTGALGAVAPGASAPGGSALVPNAIVRSFTAAPGLVAIRLTN